MPKYPEGQFDQTKYVTDFIRENYDQVMLKIPKGGKDKLKSLAKLKSLSVNALITEAIENYYHITISK